MEKKIYFSFNKRYLAVGILIYILSAYLALGMPKLSVSGTRLFFGYNIIFVILTLIVFAIFAGVFRKNREMMAFSFSALAGILIFVLGFMYTFSFVGDMDRQEEILSKHPYIYGKVKSEPILSSSGKSYGFEVDVYTATDKKTSITFDEPCRVMLYVYKQGVDKIPQIGDSLKCGMAMDIHGEEAYEGAFEYRKYLRQNGIVYAGYTYHIEEHRELEPKNPFVSKFEMLGYKIRDKFLESTNRSAYGDEAKGLLQGIIVGDKDNMTEDSYRNLKNSGLIHIASVSGMHTSYLYALIAFLMAFLRLPKRGVCLVAIPILVIFAATSMFTPSVCRAVIMMTILLIGNMIGRQSDSITALAVAALVLGINNPYVLENYGALLSFSATLGILVYFPLISKKLSIAIMKRPNRALPPLRRLGKDMLYGANSFAINSICVSLASMIGVGYFAMRFFGYLSWGGMLAGVLAFGLVAIAFIGGYVNVLISLISTGAAELVAKVVLNPVLSAILRIAKIFSGRGFRILTPYPTKLFFVIYIFICVAIYYMLKPKEKNR